MNIGNSEDIISISSSDGIEGKEFSKELKRQCSSSPDIEQDQLKSISTNISISQGRIPRVQGSSKTVKMDLTLSFDEYIDILLTKSKKKLSNKAAMLIVEDLTIGGLGKNQKGSLNFMISMMKMTLKVAAIKF